MKEREKREFVNLQCVFQCKEVKTTRQIPERPQLAHYPPSFLAESQKSWFVQVVVTAVFRNTTIKYLWIHINTS
jgi:hypothetical protein